MAKRGRAAQWARNPKAELLARANLSVSGCWEWQAATQNQGYGDLGFGGKRWLAHRLSYTLLVAPIPDGLTIDHLCRNRRCIRPDHLEVVPMKENILRGTSASANNARKAVCPRCGNTYSRDSIRGWRRCRTCYNDWHRAHRARQRDGRPARSFDVPGQAEPTSSLSLEVGQAFWSKFIGDLVRT